MKCIGFTGPSIWSIPRMERKPKNVLDSGGFGHAEMDQSTGRPAGHGSWPGYHERNIAEIVVKRAGTPQRCMRSPMPEHGLLWIAPALLYVGNS
jgi:hypothetical protein